MQNGGGAARSALESVQMCSRDHRWPCFWQYGRLLIDRLRPRASSAPAPQTILSLIDVVADYGPASGDESRRAHRMLLGMFEAHYWSNGSPYHGPWAWRLAEPYRSEVAREEEALRGTFLRLLDAVVAGVARGSPPADDLVTQALNNDAPDIVITLWVRSSALTGLPARPSVIEDYFSRLATDLGAPSEFVEGALTRARRALGERFGLDSEAGDVLSQIAAADGDLRAQLARDAARTLKVLSPVSLSALGDDRTLLPHPESIFDALVLRKIDGP